MKLNYNKDHEINTEVLLERIDGVIINYIKESSDGRLTINDFSNDEIKKLYSCLAEKLDKLK